MHNYNTRQKNNLHEAIKLLYLLRYGILARWEITHIIFVRKLRIQIWQIGQFWSHLKALVHANSNLYSVCTLTTPCGCYDVIAVNHFIFQPAQISKQLTFSESSHFHLLGGFYRMAISYVFTEIWELSWMGSGTCHIGQNIKDSDWITVLKLHAIYIIMLLRL